MMRTKTLKIETIVLYFIMKKNLEISFQNGPENETKSLNQQLYSYSLNFYSKTVLKNLRTNWKNLYVF